MYALYEYKAIESFEHQINIDRWDQSDSDIDSFTLSDDGRIGNNSAKYTHDSGTSAGELIRCLEKEEDFDTNYTYLFLSYKTASSLTHSGAEGFGLSDGTNIDWFHPNTSYADTWEFCKKTLSAPDNDNGADLTAVTKLYYSNNNANSIIYLDFACVAEQLIAFNNSNRRVGRAANITYPQDHSEIISQNNGGAIVHMGHGLKNINLQILLKDTTHWTDLCTLLKAKRSGKPYLLETDFWILPVIITSVDFTSRTIKTSENSEGNYYIINITFQEYLGD